MTSRRCGSHTFGGIVLLDLLLPVLKFTTTVWRLFDSLRGFSDGQVLTYFCMDSLQKLLSREVRAIASILPVTQRPMGESPKLFGLLWKMAEDELRVIFMRLFVLLD